MESQTYIKNLDVSPKKLRFFVPTIKKMSPAQAVVALGYSPQRPARIFYKAIQSAIASARLALKVGDDLLQFKTLLVEEGQKTKRYRPAGRGGVHTIRKRFAHIKIVLEAPSQPTELKRSETNSKDEEKEQASKEKALVAKDTKKEVKAKPAKTLKKKSAAKK